MAIGMDRSEVRSRLINAVRTGHGQSSAAADLYRELGFSLTPPPSNDRAWVATHAMLVQIADAVAGVIAENNRRIEAELAERCGKPAKKK